MDTQAGMSHSVQAIFLHLPAYSAGGWGKEKGDQMKKEGSARAEDVKICEICGIRLDPNKAENEVVFLQGDEMQREETCQLKIHGKEKRLSRGRRIPEPSLSLM